MEVGGPLLAALDSARRFGMKPGLDAIRRVLAALGNPQDSLRVVHVAGTNGKGQTCALLDSALRAAGLRVGRYVSPHLVSVNERFHLDGAPVPDAAIEDAFAAVRSHLPPGGLTYFELLTATAFVLYARARPDVVVLETGLGGRLDATNVVAAPLVSVVTRIGLDHCDWLGRTISAVAAEKAGIVKRGCPVVAGMMPAAALAVVERAAAEAAAPFRAVPCETVPFPEENRRTALAAIDALRDEHGLFIPDSAVARGFSSAVWPGRFHRLSSGGANVLVDGAHNPPACEALVNAIRLSPDLPPPHFLVCGFCGDKDVDANLRVLSSLSREGWAVATPNPRSLAPGETAERMRRAGFAEATPCASLASALAAAKARARETGGTAVVCGSLFLAGEALVALGELPRAGAACACEALKPEAADA